MERAFKVDWPPTAMKQKEGFMESLKAVPTEYRGVRFRSKCEAQFALWLDTVRKMRIERRNPSSMSIWEGVWRYEPKLDYLEGFSCDFELSWIEESRGVLCHKSHFVEYKPTLPTKTYCDEFFRKGISAMQKAHDKTRSGDLYRSFSLSIQFGSVYCDPSERGSVSANGEVSWCDWIGVLSLGISSHRFDLERAGCHASEL